MTKSKEGIESTVFGIKVFFIVMAAIVLASVFSRYYEDSKLSPIEKWANEAGVTYEPATYENLGGGQGIENDAQLIFAEDKRVTLFRGGKVEVHGTLIVNTWTLNDSTTFIRYIYPNKNKSLVFVDDVVPSSEGYHQKYITLRTR